MTDSKMEETQKEVASPTKESPSANSSASPKSSPTKKDIDIATQALNHFAQGKRHLLVQDISSAVNSLQAASQLLAEHYGETAPECADAYFYYGKALLELARIENGVLGNALDGVPESEDENNSQVEDPEKLTEEEKDMVSEIVGDALEENFTESEEKQKPTKDCSATNHKESLNSETDKGDENVVSGTKSTKDGEEVEICRSDEQGNEKEAEEKMDTEEVIKDVKKDKESEVEAVITESKATSEGPTLQKDKESTTTGNKDKESTTTDKDKDTTTDKDKDKETTTTVNEHKDTTSTDKDTKSTTTDDKDKETTTTDKNKESTTTDKNKESTTTDKDKESTTTDKDKESTTTDKDKESTTTDKDKESTTTDDKDKESTTTDHKDKESTTTDDKDKESTTTDDKDKESTTTDDKDKKSTTADDKDKESTTIDNHKESTTTDDMDKESTTGKEKETTSDTDKDCATDKSIVDKNDVKKMEVDCASKEESKNGPENESVESKSEVPEKLKGEDAVETPKESELSKEDNKENISEDKKVCTDVNMEDSDSDKLAVKNEGTKEKVDTKPEAEIKPSSEVLKEEQVKKSPQKGDIPEVEKMEVEEKSDVKKDESTEDEDNEDKDDESQDDAEGEASQEEGDEEAAKENGEASDEPEGEKTEESEEEDVSNLQLAWEMLELSKVIYSKQLESNPSMNLKIAQVHLALGEVGMESENYAQSVEDFQQCLNIQTKELKDDDRCLAESHYQMGVAHSFADDFDKAIESFKSAANVIESRISNLQIQQKEKESWTEEQKKKDAAEKKDPFYTEAAEIEELNSLLPEIKEKIVDMEEMKKDSKEKLQKIKEATFASVLGGSRSNGASTSGETSTGFPAASSLPSSETISAKPATNISHLIRKKRKPEDEPEKEDTKKAKGENGEEMKTVTSLNGKEENGSPSEETSNSKDVQMKELPEVSTEVSEKKTEVAS